MLTTFEEPPEENSSREEETPLLKELQKRRAEGNEELMFQVEIKGKRYSLIDMAHGIINRHFYAAGYDWRSSYAGEALNTALEQYLISNERSEKKDDPEEEEKRKRNLMYTIADRKAITLRERLLRIAMLDPESLKYGRPVSLNRRLKDEDGEEGEEFGAMEPDPKGQVDEAPLWPEEAVLDQERRRERELMIRGALAVLDPKHRSIISVKFDAFDERYTDWIGMDRRVTNEAIAEECGIPVGQVSDQVKKSLECMRIGLKTLENPRMRLRLEMFVRILESRVGESRVDFSAEVQEAVSWAESWAQKNEAAGGSPMPRQVVRSLSQLWEEVDVKGHRLSHKDEVKQRIVAACAAYVSLEEDGVPDRLERGFKDDFDVVVAIRETFGMQIGMKRKSARESLKVFSSFVINRLGNKSSEADDASDAEADDASDAEAEE